MKKMLMLVGAMLVVFYALADQWVDPNTGITWTYTLSGDGASVGSGSSSTPAVPKSTTGALVIPSKLDGHAVTSIGEYAFYSCVNLTMVTISEGVTDIGDYAFYNCRITSIELPSSLKKIDSQAFNGCRLLSCVSFGDGLLDIGNGAFARCESLKNISLPESVTNVAEYAFNYCTSLEALRFPENTVSISRGVCEGCTSLKSVVLPDNVSGSISYNAFFECSSLEEVVVPRGITEIGETAFGRCASLSSISLPDGIALIGSGAFAGCGNLAGNTDGIVIVNHYLLRVNGECSDAVNIPNDVRIIAGGAFAGITNITAVMIPSSVEDIGPSAFSGCIGIKDVVISEGVKRIGYNCFYNCKCLKSVVVPSTVTYIGSKAFGGWDLGNIFATITFYGSPPEVGGALYEYKDGVRSGRYSAYRKQWESVISNGKWQGLYMSFDEEAGSLCYVTFSAGAHGKIVEGDLSQDVEKGEAAIPPKIVADDGYEFTGWDSSCEDVLADVTITACYRPITYAITYLNVNGAVNENTNSYTIEDSVFFSSLPNLTDFAFIKWSTNSIPVGSVGDMTVTAIWRDISCSTVLGRDVGTWSSYGNEKWFSVWDGGLCDYVARSGKIADSQESEINVKVYGAGIVSFKWRVSSEIVKTTPIDYCQFLIDGIEKTRIGGEVGWAEMEYELTGNQVHTLTWKYTKDGADLSGDDCVYLADVKWVAADPIPELNEDAGEQEIADALTGSTDTNLIVNIIDAENYNAYREWAGKVKGTDGNVAGAEKVKKAPNSWLSFALATDALIKFAPSNGDVKIETFEPTATGGKFNFTVSIKDIEVGSSAAAENLKRVFGLEGGSSLGSLSSDNVNVTFGTPENGNVKFTAEPNAENAGASSFFMKVKLNQ